MVNTRLWNDNDSDNGPGKSIELYLLIRNVEVNKY